MELQNIIKSGVFNKNLLNFINLHVGYVFESNEEMEMACVAYVFLNAGTNKKEDKEYYEKNLLFKDEVIPDYDFGNISFWNTSKINDMDYNLENLNYDVSDFDFNTKVPLLWDTRFVSSMNSLFKNTKINFDISYWIVHNLVDAGLMFYGADFNGDISRWDTSNLKLMDNMFSFSTFNKDISKWNIQKVVSRYKTFKNCPIKAEYKCTK